MPVPGLNGVHQIGAVRLGDMTIWPRYRLTSIPGFRSLGALEDARENPAGRSLEIPRKSLRRGKAFSYAGVIEARTPAELDSAIDELTYACAPTEELRVTVTTIIMPPAVPSFFYYGRVTALDPNEVYPDANALGRLTRGHERPFAIGVRMSDARFFEETPTILPTAGISSEGGTALSWVLPVIIAAPQTTSGSVSINYTGFAPADPVFDMYGPATNPGMRSDTLGVEIRFLLTLPEGQFLRVDFRNRTALLGGVEDVHSSLDRSRSTWWDGDTDGLVPRTVNALRYVGDALQSPAYANITYNNSHWS